MFLDFDTAEKTLKAAEHVLRSARKNDPEASSPSEHWTGKLSSSALSTATAVFALDLLDRTKGTQDFAGPVNRGIEWLVGNVNADGGWGDTADSPSNISTTALCWAALGVTEQPSPEHRSVVDRAHDWLARRAGEADASRLAKAINAVYGEDHTFSVPILTMCALAGRFGTGRKAWAHIPSLPFELAVLPRSWFHRLGLPVVSYALPALIAIGQARHYHRPTSNPITRFARKITCRRTLDVLQSVQPQSGGFLEAVPLTSFVLMSLVSIGHGNHPVARRSSDFLRNLVRNDGSWPIDANLATWVTTLSVNALTADKELPPSLQPDERTRIREWLLDQQHVTRHPYTYAAPGGWAWTDLSGGVPDADDTPGALLALWNLTIEDESGGVIDTRTQQAVEMGVRWLLGLQNKDGGIPTFCRGWGKLPFDRSSPDLTAHTIRAWDVWRNRLPASLREDVARANCAAVEYLVSIQRSDGAWVPLWFGNQHSKNQENPLYGTSRVLCAPADVRVDAKLYSAWSNARARGVSWILEAQNTDGGWGGDSSTPSTIEETALAVEALADILLHTLLKPGRTTHQDGNETQIDRITGSIGRSVHWLIANTDGGKSFPPAPIGLYFANLWYCETLYPVIFTVSALAKVLRLREYEKMQSL